MADHQSAKWETAKTTIWIPPGFFNREPRQESKETQFSRKTQTDKIVIDIMVHPYTLKDV